VISNLVEVTWFVSPAQLVGLVGREAAFPVVDGDDGLEPLVKETLPVVAGAACPVVIGLADWVVSGLGA